MLHLQSADLSKEKVETLVIPVCEDKEIHEDKVITGLIRRARKIKTFKGEKDDELIFYSDEKVSADQIIFKGIGKAEKLDPEAFRALCGKAVQGLVKQEIKEVLFAVPSAKKCGLDPEALTTAMMEGAFLGNHVFDRYKKEKKERPVEKIEFLVKADLEKKLADLPPRVETICAGTVMAREWISMPSNHKTPDQFAHEIAKQAEETDLQVTVLDEKALEEKGFGALLAVGAGSLRPPRLVILDYAPKGAEKTIAIIGKGVTFDSGGLDIKSRDGMETMKSDMSGAAAVGAALITLSKLGPAKLGPAKIGASDKRIIGILPLAENMPSGGAARPGDIIRTYSGKTVEIGNTDAEGRLILADAIAYAVETYKPDALIDMATLTGACLMALGEKIAAVFSFEDELPRKILESADKTHERCWRMPLPEDYKELLKSEFADINNMPNSPWGGAITAALFLSEFVGETRWAHIDIAGPSYSKKKDAYAGPGGKGFGVRLLCDLMERL